jgi:hypothetical protein
MTSAHDQIRMTITRHVCQAHCGPYIANLIARIGKLPTVPEVCVTIVEIAPYRAQEHSHASQPINRGTRRHRKVSKAIPIQVSSTVDADTEA